MIRQYELVERVREYDRSTDEATLDKAYVFSMKAHGAQRRASGDPYFSHPLEVAGILTDMGLDWVTIATALLHDTIEDTDVSYEEIEQNFGTEIAKLVDGVTKLSRIEFSTEGTQQAENFRKLVLAMSDDLRVLLVKLADRLHNMRTLGYIKDPEKRARIAAETMDIYAPFAERMGMQTIKDELEDLAFAELNPAARDSIVTRLEILRSEGEGRASRIIGELERVLAEHKVKARVEGREKRPYSILRKMERKNVSFEQLSDIMAFRFITKDVATCYKVLGVLHSTWSMVPDRFKDYISTPKLNEYQSIHTTLVGPESQRIESQIRTEKMHEIAELGVAAHWSYKTPEEKAEGSHFRWMRELVEILEHASSPEEFLEHTKLEMFQDQVFVFTPRGELIALPRGATPVDFAYAVHTDVGNSCVSAKVNGQRVPLRYQIANGDQVEIIRSKGQKPSPTWENFVITGKARSEIRRFIRKEERAQYRRLGKAIIEKAFSADGRDYSGAEVRPAVKVLNRKNLDDLYVAMGEGLITARQVMSILFPRSDFKSFVDKVVALPSLRGRRRRKGTHPVPIRGLTPGLALHYAECCHPLPGERIVGIVSHGEGVIIHTIDCEVTDNFVATPERWLDVSWDKEGAKSQHHVGRINTRVSNEAGSLGNLLTDIGKYVGNISNLKITNRTKDFFEVVIDIEVTDVRHLTNIITALRASPTVDSVKRARG